ncbi:WGR domain-containing protein (plasmid) [Rhizobium sp. CB3171]|uniref:WGR domain-containing protein n=1 Tax=Rhizobium sp. CB3171 TaxID=3039157 RepID=UPI0024B0C640|nr:WGR domain-containing protein [Rhizobium sp. CB3171]WFU07500.1 WGR domain-containing protein [Rhizobium sp. CB3171]
MAIFLTRTEPSQNMARFWTVAVQRNLFGHYVALRQWGRIGAHGQVCEEWFDEERQAVQAAAGFLKAKLKRGYNPVSA